MSQHQPYTENEREMIGRAVYNERWEGYYVKTWDELPSDRKWFWIRAGLNAIRTAQVIEQHRQRSRAVPVQKMDTLTLA